MRDEEKKKKKKYYDKFKRIGPPRVIILSVQLFGAAVRVSRIAAGFRKLEVTECLVRDYEVRIRFR